MSWWNTNPVMQMNFVSGILHVTVRSSARWFILVLGIAVPVGVLAVFLPYWHGLSLFVRTSILGALISDFGALFFKLSGTEVIEFSQNTFALTREIRGWERRREYPTADCREMQWDEGSEGVPQGLKCKAGQKWIRFAEDLTESQANEMFCELQNRLPVVAASVFSFSEGRKSFLELGLR